MKSRNVVKAALLAISLAFVFAATASEPSELTRMPSDWWKGLKTEVLHIRDISDETLTGEAVVIELRFPAGTIDDFISNQGK